MELFDLYDRDRIPLHRQAVRGEGIPEGTYHIVIHICLFNAVGQMLIQQRASVKSDWADCWDISVGGSAVAGETSGQAAHRELLEELGLDISFDAERPYLTVQFERGFDDIYLLSCEADPETLTLQPEEVQAARWAGRDEILSMIEDGSFIPYHPELIDLLFAIRKNRGAHSR